MRCSRRIWFEGAGRGSRGWLSDSVVEEKSAQKKNVLDASSFASLFFESVCQGGAHIDRKNSNSSAMARHIVEPEFLTLPGPAESIFRPEGAPGRGGWRRKETRPG